MLFICSGPTITLWYRFNGFKFQFADNSPLTFSLCRHLIRIRLIHMHETASRTTDLGLKPTGRARQQGDPNVPDQPNQRGQDVKYFPNDLMQYKNVQRWYGMVWCDMLCYGMICFVVWYHIQSLKHLPSGTYLLYFLIKGLYWGYFETILIY